MDRFGVGERDKKLTYRKALEFLGEVRSGISWDRFTNLSVQYFEPFLDIINNTDTARAYLEEANLDRNYIVSGIRGVLYRLHFNRENNHYLTLCLPNNVTEEEIHKRWKDLMLLYHPDRNRDDDQALECAKKINESYSVLKDNNKRALYNSELIKKAFRAKTPYHKEQTVEQTVFRQRDRRVIQAIKVSIFLIPVIVLIVFFVDRKPQVFELDVYQRQGEQKETQKKEPKKAPLMASIDRTASEQATDKGSKKSNSVSSQEQDRETKRDNKPPFNNYKDSQSSKPTHGTPTVKLFPEFGIINKEQVASKNEQSDKKNIHTTLDRTDDKDRAAIPSVEKDSSVKVKTEVANITPIARKTEDKTDDKDRATIPSVEKDSSVKVKTEVANITPIAKKEPSHQDTSSDLMGEINAFLSQYRQSYERGKIEPFIALYSTTAIENGMPFNEIKKAYEKYFNSDRYNSIEFHGIQAKEREGNINITGKYRISKRTENTVSSSKEGTIRWTLTRIGKQLKIVRAEYDRS